MGKREKSEMLPVCRKIAAGSLLEHKFQSACVIAAVMLTTVLFTTVFASVFYFQSSIRQAQMENAAWTAHGAVIGVSEEQIRAMAQDSRVSDASCYQHLGFLKDDAADEVIEMQYCEDKLASWMFYEPVWGHMPTGRMEAVVSTQLLESWGIAPKGRETIRLSYTVNGILKEADFTICGAYEQKPSSAEVMFVSQEFCRRELAEASGDENRDSMLGVRVAEVMFQSDARLQRSMEQLMEQIGAQENDWMLNPAFADSAGMDTGVAAALAGVLAVIMLCGYFIIYNIYNISVMQDTRFYGSLAVMGFLKTEILGIVHAKTNMLCAIAIPLGFLPGVGLAMVFLPKIMASFGFLSVKAVPHPLIFLFSALFSYITVRISSRRPARIAAGMEPVLARRFVRAGAGRTKASKSKNGCRMHVMAWKHMMRDRRKSLMICGSLVMCVMLSALFYTISKGMNLEVFLKDMITSDFIIADRSYFNQAQGGHEPAVLDSGRISRLARQDGLEASGGACVAWMDVPLSGKTYDKYRELAGESDTYQDGTMHWTPVYGLDAYIYRKIEVLKGMDGADSLDWEAFSTGRYVIAGGFVQSGGKESCFEPGDKVTLPFEHGSEEYTVLAVGNMPHDLSVRFRYSMNVELYLPADEWMRQTQSGDYYVYAYDVKEDYEQQWEKSMAALKQADGRFLYESRTTFRGQFEGFAGGIAALGISVSTILGTIGLMNFVNVIYSSIYNRRREIAVMQGMGMLHGQVYRMLATEGCCYMLLSWTGSIAAGVPLGYFAVQALGREMEFFQYEQHMGLYAAYGAAGAVLAVCVPCLIFYVMDKRENLLYRLRHD